MTVGQKIHMLRIARDLTMDELGAMIGVQKSAINKYEHGVVTDLKQSTILSLAKALGCSPVYLLEDDDASYEDYVQTYALSELGELTIDEREFLIRYRELSEDGKSYLLQQLGIAGKMFPKEAP